MLTYEQLPNAPLDALQEAALRWKAAADRPGSSRTPTGSRRSSETDTAILPPVDEPEAGRENDERYLAEHPEEHRADAITQVRPWPN
ncbi:hypothetical protein [Kitasatospora sp. NPDC057198]|uniref:hypothetical protein n=1 Tax=Kitasatospora sp. NPDC057198 TaxID=3346046 RepID=UPI00362E60ED